MKDLFHALDAAIETPHLLISLDRDGTLVPYASRPELAVMNDEISNLLGRLSQLQGVEVAIISARSIAQLQADLSIGKLILAGNYGMEVLFPDGRLCLQPDATKTVPSLKHVRDILAVRIDLNGGAILEDHGYSLCLHFQAVCEEHRADLKKTVESVAEEFTGVRFRKLPTSYEVLPPMLWDKGRALEFINSKLRGGQRRRSFLYAGDSEADLPAFNWVTAHNGVSIRVGGSGTLGAQFHIASTDHLQAVLEHVFLQRAQMSAA